jgi:hypothetical protein
MKKLFVLVLFAIISMSAFCQEPEQATIAGSIVDWIVENWTSGIGLALILTTILSRFIPTEKATLYLDVITWLIKLIPNRKKGGGVHN